MFALYGILQCLFRFLLLINYTFVSVEIFLFMKIKKFIKNLLKLWKNEKKCDIIYSESFTNEGIGCAIMNRLLKSAGYKIIGA